MNDSVPNMKTVWEAKQEFLGASFGQKNTKALARYLEEHPEMRDLEEGEVYELIESV